MADPAELLTVAGKDIRTLKGEELDEVSKLMGVWRGLGETDSELKQRMKLEAHSKARYSAPRYFEDEVMGNWGTTEQANRYKDIKSIIKNHINIVTQAVDRNGFNKLNYEINRTKTGSYSFEVSAFEVEQMVEQIIKGNIDPKRAPITENNPVLKEIEKL